MDGDYYYILNFIRWRAGRHAGADEGEFRCLRFPPRLSVTAASHGLIINVRMPIVQIWLELAAHRPASHRPILLQAERNCAFFQPLIDYAII